MYDLIRHRSKAGDPPPVATDSSRYLEASRNLQGLMRRERDAFVVAIVDAFKRL